MMVHWKLFVKLEARDQDKNWPKMMLKQEVDTGGDYK